MSKKQDPVRFRWRPPHTLLRASPRSSRWLRVTLLLAFVVGTFHCVERFHTFRAALLLKYTPTTFPRLTLEEQAALANPRWQWADHDLLDGRSIPETYSRKTLLADRHEWSRLGAGWEGETFKWGDSVVKVYEQQRAPFRNCVPGWVPELRWPTEISASLILGGLSERNLLSADDVFLPVTDYFLSPPIGDQTTRWHFVTPFQRNGNVKGLGAKLWADEKDYTARDLDIIFRPSLERILQALNRMHVDYDLCHDDLKLDNIFLGSSTLSPGEEMKPNETTHWLLADLGNARERDHPYHTSILWLQHKRNLADCGANDVFRLVKIYMDFLRRSVADVNNFNHEFFEASEPWSRLFWSILDEIWSGELLPTAASTLERSVTEFPAAGEPVEAIGRQPAGLSSLVTQLLWGRWWLLSKATKDAIGVSASEKVARFWGMVGLFGVPRQSCSAGTA